MAQYRKAVNQKILLDIIFLCLAKIESSTIHNYANICNFGWLSESAKQY